jgi:Zn-dependent protease
MQGTMIVDLVTMLVTMVLSLAVHEFAHAKVAVMLGDPTPREQERDNLNPLSHIDPIGTLLIPVMLAVTKSPFFFGWAKPVEWNAARVRRDIPLRRATVLISIAGVCANMILATICAVLIGLALRFGWFNGAGEPLKFLLVRLIQVNVGLAIFNLLPVPPLDGSKVLWGLLSESAGEAYNNFMRSLGMIGFLLVVLFAGRVIRPPAMAMIDFFLYKVVPLVSGV